MTFCRCGDPKESHLHYLGGSHCSRCTCPAWVNPRRSWWDRLRKATRASRLLA